jgi:hypothetical protein
MRKFLVGLLRTLPDTRPDESFFSAGPVRSTSSRVTQVGPGSSLVRHLRSRRAPYGLGRHRNVTP